MAKKDELFAEIRPRRGTGPEWLRAPRKGEPMYFLGHNSKTGKTLVFRGSFFVLPTGIAPENADLEKVTTAGSLDGLTGDYVDFLLEDSPIRYQTIRSLLSEVFGIKTTKKLKKKVVKKSKKKR